MTIKIYQGNRLTGSSFFRALIEFLDQGAPVGLRQIRAEYPDQLQLDRLLEELVQAGLIWRENKRYGINFPIFEDSLADGSESPPQIHLYEGPIFLREGSSLQVRLESSLIYQNFSNKTNQISIHETSDFARSRPTLSNYFFKIRGREPLTPFEKEVYDWLGDVDPDYAGKYMTSFLLKFQERDLVSASPDIFIRLLENYGFLEKKEGNQYRRLIDFQEGQGEDIPQIHHKDPASFITAQLKQRQPIKNYISLGGRNGRQQFTG